MLHWGMLPRVGYSRVRYTEVRYTEARYTDVGYTRVHSSRVRYTRRLPYADFRYPTIRYIKTETHLFSCDRHNSVFLSLEKLDTDKSFFVNRERAPAQRNTFV